MTNSLYDENALPFRKSRVYMLLHISMALGWLVDVCAVVVEYDAVLLGLVAVLSC